MLSERDVTTMWRNLFHEQEVSSATLAKAEALLDRLNLESPLRSRLATELEEIRKLDQVA